MTTLYKKADTVAEILNDLVRIHNDRIAGYEQALMKVTDIDESLRCAFEDIILNAERFKKQLSEKKKDLESTGKSGTTIFGKVYRAWVDLKMTFTGSTRKAIISYCQYNEDIAHHAYKAALNLHVNMNSDIRLLLEEQQEALQQSYTLVKNYRETPHFSLNTRLAYTVGIF